MTIVTQGGIAAPEIELLVQIIRKLDQARNLAVEVGGFNVRYVLIPTRSAARQVEAVGSSDAIMNWRQPVDDALFSVVSRLTSPGDCWRARPYANWRRREVPPGKPVVASLLPDPAGELHRSLCERFDKEGLCPRPCIS
jgi:hypothetical protein